MKLFIGADIVPTDINKTIFEEGRLDQLLGNDLLTLLMTGDLRILNLEVPLTDYETPIPKFGCNLKSPQSTITAFDGLKPLFLTLANNHCLDQGVSGLRDTIRLLKEHDIWHAGAGDSLIEARRPFVFDQKGQRIGFYTCSEHEFSIAQEESPGANPFDPLESYDEVEALSNTCDYVIVLYHGGKEYYRYPSPMLQRYCRKFIEKGADLVITQHCHCIGCREEYQGKTIVYGQGNFIFHTENFLPYQSYINQSILLEVTTDNGFNVQEVPIVKTKNNSGIRLANEEQAQAILKAYKKRSHQIQEPGFIQECYQHFADQYIRRYLREFLGRNPVSHLLYGLSRRKLMDWLLNQEGYLAIQNYLECQAHQELFLQGVKKKVSYTKK